VLLAICIVHTPPLHSFAYSHCCTFLFPSHKPLYLMCFCFVSFIVTWPYKPATFTCWLVYMYLNEDYSETSRYFIWRQFCVLFARFGTNYQLTQYCIPGEQNPKRIPYSSFCLYIYSQLAVNRQTVGRMMKVLPVK